MGGKVKNNTEMRIGYYRITHGSYVVLYLSTSTSTAPQWKVRNPLAHLWCRTCVSNEIVHFVSAYVQNYIFIFYVGFAAAAAPSLLAICVWSILIRWSPPHHAPSEWGKIDTFYVCNMMTPAKPNAVYYALAVSFAFGIRVQTRIGIWDTYCCRRCRPHHCNRMCSEMT